jgi:anti-sigma regulatory factor (Ser/Thr protein kinase)
VSVRAGPTGQREHPRSVRRAITELLTAAGWIDADIEDALLVTSELVTNAVRHAGGVERIELQVDGHLLVLVVHDRSVTFPAQSATPPGELGGHGLQIVAGISDAWGAALDPEGGKHVWSRILR